MREKGVKRPLHTASHHVVPLFDKRGTIARKILADFGIDIDIAENGVFLPRFETHVPHPKMKNAYAHSIIHTDHYYTNISTLLEAEAAIEGTTKEDIISTLCEIAQDLQCGTFPINKKLSVK